MTMGQDGMGDMGEMGMAVPREQHPDGRRTGAVRLHHDGRHVHDPEGAREARELRRDPGWYENPPGTLAIAASDEDLRRDLGFIPDATPAKGGGGHQHKPG